MYAPPSTASASISVLGLKMPKWALYVGGGALALMVIGVIATRKKPTTPVGYSDGDSDEDEG